MVLTVQLLRHDTIVLLNCPIKAQIRAVDGQSDLRILLMEPKPIILWNCKHFRPPTDEQVGHVDILIF